MDKTEVSMKRIETKSAQAEMNGINDRGGKLLFNIGPSFLHVTSFNKYTGRSFNYFFESNSCKHSVMDKFNCNISETPICDSNKLILKLNSKKHCLLRVNVYKEKCICEKHLAKTFLFFGGKPTELRTELLEILSSEYCINWDQKWVELLFEQMLLFFCCVKENKILERLLDFAGLCAKMILRKDFKKDLIAFKYSYISFHQSFANKIALSIKERNSKEENKRIINRYSHIFGKYSEYAEIDIIEDFAILSFETEKEMNLFTQLDQCNVNKKKASIKFHEARNNVYRDATSTGISSLKKKQKTDRRQAVPNGGINIVELSPKRRLEIEKNYFDKKLQAKCQNKEVQTNELDFLNFEQNNSTKTKNCLIEALDGTTKELQKDFNKSLGGVNHLNEDVKQNLKIVDEFTNLKSYIPVIHGCGKSKNEVSSCKCKHFTLNMVLTIGKGRPFPKEAIENLNTLEGNKNEISRTMAVIAACAFQDPRKGRTVKRIMVPVKSDAIVQATKLPYNTNLAFRNTPTETSVIPKSEVDPEVKKVVNDMVDFIVNFKSYQPTILYDLSESESVKYKQRMDRKRKSKVVRELCKLNASLIDEDSSGTSNTNCANDFCVNGCVCNSLNDKINLPLHCRKVSCLFDCICTDREVNEQNLLQTGQSNSQTSVVEKHNKQMPKIRILDGKKFGLTNLVDRCQREIKLSTRFKNSVLLDDALLPVSSAPTRTNKTNTVAETVSPVKSKVETYKKSDLLSRRLNFCADIIESKKMLGDLFIWCGKHHRYNCLCMSWICLMKHNALIYNPKRSLRYLPYKLLMKTEYKCNNNYEVYFYDSQAHCARTYGAPINYALRNSTAIFQGKRKFELSKGVISSTNSYIKMNFSIYKMLEDENKNEIKNEVYKCSTVENVHLKAENEDEWLEVEVCEESGSSSDMDTIIILSDSEEDEVTSCTHSGSTRPVLNSFLDTEETLPPEQNSSENVGKPFDQKQNNELENVITTERIYCKERNEQLGQGKILIDLSVEGNQGKAISHINKQPNKEIDHPKKEQNMKAIPLVRLTNCSRENNANNNFRKEAKQLLQNSMDIHPNYDANLENELIQLEDHPLKEEIYGADDLPKLSLFCLTPGIGYLPIVEYTQDVLVVQDPVSPLLLHSFKNLNSANIWLNNFLKDFLVFESVDICLKWVVVKPGIIKLKKSLPFTPAILENSSIIITKDGELVLNTGLDGFVDNGQRHRTDSMHASHAEVEIKELVNRKRKLTEILPNIIINKKDIDEKRRKMQAKLISPVILKRPVNMMRCYPGKKQSGIALPTIRNVQLAMQTSPKETLAVRNNASPVTDSVRKTVRLSLNKFVSIVKSPKQQTTPLKHYKFIPANLLIPKTVSPLLISQNCKANGEQVSKFKIISDSISGTSKIVACQSLVMPNNSRVANSENLQHMIKKKLK